MQKLGNGLGYNAWIKVPFLTNAPTLDVRNVEGCENSPVAHVHPSICASKHHADNIDGCEIGDLICGVRWFSH